MICYDIKKIYCDIIENHDIIVPQGSRCTQLKKQYDEGGPGGSMTRAVEGL